MSRAGPLGDVGEQTPDGEDEQPGKGDQQRDQGHAGDEREDVVVGARRPVPQQVVAEREQRNDDQARPEGPMGHALNRSGERGRTGVPPV